MNAPAYKLQPSPYELLLERTLAERLPLLDETLTAPLRAFLARPGKQLRVRLVELSWELAGGQGAVPPELPLAIELLHAGSLIVDDIEDGSPERRGVPALHVQVGVPVALNAGNWLYFAALNLLAPWPRALCRAVSMLARCHEGQALDVGVKVSSLAQRDVPRVARDIAERKTGGLAALATTTAGLCAGADEQTIKGLEHLGERLGVALQILDDTGSIAADHRRAKGEEDLRLGRTTFAWAVAAEQLPPPAWRLLRTLGLHVEKGSARPAELLLELRKIIGDRGRELARAELAGMRSKGLAELIRALEVSYG